MDETTPPDPQPTPTPPEPEPTPPVETPPVVEEAPLPVETPAAPEEVTTPTEPTPTRVEEAQPSVVETVATPSEPEATPPAETPPAVPYATPVESAPPPPAAAPALTLDEMLARLSPTELKALFKKYLLQIGTKGIAKRKAQLEEKKHIIITHVGIHGRITHKEVMQLTHSAKTTATRIIEELEKKGKLVQHGGYKDHAAYYTLRL